MLPFSKGAGQVPRRLKYRRRPIVLLLVLHLRTYLDLLAQDKVTSPIPCPDGCKEGRWWAHSQFERQWVDVDCLVCRLTIIRLQCSVCRAVWSLFPAFVWYRFRFSYQLIQWVCRSVLAGASLVALEDRLTAEAYGRFKDGDEIRVPAENTIRSWLTWLGAPWMERVVRWIQGQVARISAPAARAAAPQLALSGSLTGPARCRRRTERFLTVCAVLDALKRGRTSLFRATPHQFRDWAAAFFCEQRQVLARPP